MLQHDSVYSCLYVDIYLILCIKYMYSKTLETFICGRFLDMTHAEIILLYTAL